MTSRRTDLGETRASRQRRNRRAPNTADFELADVDFAQLNRIDPNSPTLSRDLAELIETARAKSRNAAERVQEKERLRSQIANLEYIVDEVEADDFDEAPLVCASCGEAKPANRYYRGGFRHGRAGDCRACQEKSAKNKIERLKRQLAELT